MKPFGRIPALSIVLLGCAAPVPGPAGLDPSPGVSVSVATPLVVGGYQCVSSGTCADLSFEDLPEDREYYLTTFDGGLTSCQNQADGTWPYIAGRARWGCGARVLVTNPENGKSCVTQVADCGPNRCVEQAAKKPVIDASPVVAQHLLNRSHAGWSDEERVIAYEIGRESQIGCPGLVIGDGPDAGTGGADGADVADDPDTADDAPPDDAGGEHGAGDVGLADDDSGDAAQSAELAADLDGAERDAVSNGHDAAVGDPDVDDDEDAIGWSGCAAGTKAPSFPWAVLLGAALLWAWRRRA